MQQQDAQLHQGNLNNRQWLANIQQARLIFIGIRNEIWRYNNLTNGRPLLPLLPGQQQPTIQSVQNVVNQGAQNLNRLQVPQDPNFIRFSGQDMASFQADVNQNPPNMMRALNTVINFINNRLVPRENGLNASINQRMQ